MNNVSMQAVQALPKAWVAVETGDHSVELRDFVLDLVQVLFTEERVVEERDGKKVWRKVWNLDKEVSGSELINHIHCGLEDIGLLPQGEYVPASWDELKRGDRVALFPAHLVTLTDAEPGLFAALRFPDGDLRGLSSSWVVDDPERRTVRRIVHEHTDSQLLSSHVYQYQSDTIFKQDRGY